MILYVFDAICAFFLLTGIINGSADMFIAPLGQRWRRKRYRAVDTVDPVQAAANAHVAIMAPGSGVAVALVTPEGTQQVFAGHVDGRGSPTPDAQTPFEIGSLTKTFTAALLVALERAGKISFDTSLDSLLPPDGKLGRQLPVPVTLAALATHTSGLPRLPWGWRTLAGLYLTPRQPYRFLQAAAVQRWLRHRKLRYGRRFRYSNLGYGVLGNVLGGVVGSSYAEAAHQRVLQPLGLAATACNAAAPCAQPHTALGRRIPAWNLCGLAAAGGIRSNLADMTRWLGANMAETAPLDARLHRARENSGGKHRSVALAWFVDGEGERRVVWHNGRTGGSASLAAFAPAYGVGVVVLSNAAVSVDALGMSLLRAAIVAHLGTQAASGELPQHLQRIRDV